MGSMDIRDHLHDSMRKEAIFHDQSRPTTGSVFSREFCLKM